MNTKTDQPACRQCDWSSPYPGSVRRHTKREHEDNGSQFKCHLCPVTCKWDKRSLNMHIASKHGSPCAPCNQCNFVGNSQALTHRHQVRTHERRYKQHIHACNQCDKSYNTKSGLTVHEKRVHWGLRRVKKPAGNWECVLCPKIFTQKQYRSRHLKYFPLCRCVVELIYKFLSNRHFFS